MSSFTVTGSSGAKATIQAGINLCVDTDRLHIKKATTNYEESLTCSEVIVIVGYDDDYDDDGMVINDGTNETSTIGLSINITAVPSPSAASGVIANFTCQNFDSDGLKIVESYSGNMRYILRNDSFSTNGGHGVNSAATSLQFVNTHCDNNTSDGCSAGGLHSAGVNATFINNGSEGISSLRPLNFTNSIFAKNTGVNIQGDGGVLTQCIVDDSDTHGINTVTRTQWGYGASWVLINTSVTNNGGLGLNSVDDNDTIINCLMNGNTSGNYDQSPYVSGLVTSAPQYTDQANEDYTPASGSPLIDAGSQPIGLFTETTNVSDGDIGLQLAPSSGGGTSDTFRSSIIRKINQ